jgi:hypothetical protein
MVAAAKARTARLSTGRPMRLKIALRLDVGGRRLGRLVPDGAHGDVPHYRNARRTSVSLGFRRCPLRTTRGRPRRRTTRACFVERLRSSAPAHNSRLLRPTIAVVRSPDKRARRSSGSGVNSRPADTSAYQRSSGSPSRVAGRPLLRFVHLDSAAAVGGVATDCSIRREAAVSTRAPARRPFRLSDARPARRSQPRAEAAAIAGRHAAGWSLAPCTRRAEAQGEGGLAAGMLGVPQSARRHSRDGAVRAPIARRRALGGRARPLPP